jgi:hypothetical protein
MKINYIETILLSVFFGLLVYGGYLSYKSIDFKVLDKLESIPLVLPTPNIASSSATPAPSATP